MLFSYLLPQFPQPISYTTQDHLTLGNITYSGLDISYQLFKKMSMGQSNRETFSTEALSSQMTLVCN